MPGDYDGDGKADVAIYRPQTGMWFILQSSTGFTGRLGYGWGASGDVPVASDYDGDGTTDIAVYRPSSAYWFILKSSSHFTAWDLYQWGSTGDLPVPADYDGDVKADLAVYRPSSGLWHILHSSTGFTDGQDYTWGLGEDVPVAGDYDGDGTADIAMYRPSTGQWFILKSSTTFTTSDTYHWGTTGDVPIPPACCGLMPGAGHAATFIVTVPWDGTDVNPGDGVCETVPGNRICTLRAAVMEANRAPGSTIEINRIVMLDIPPSGTDDETTGDLNIVATVTIAGGDPATAVIDANGAVTHDRAMRIEAGIVDDHGRDH